MKLTHEALFERLKDFVYAVERKSRLLEEGKVCAYLSPEWYSIFQEGCAALAHYSGASTKADYTEIKFYGNTILAHRVISTNSPSNILVFHSEYNDVITENLIVK